ncbi:ribosome biogenesis GTPase YqeH [Thermotoga profunda]|uniref:ribosome biogenesis GTPase YqeH n=1 Tax=Thermotoga profunda TaxID=1508420 RepID=UPI000597523D|nr:ribosome biogenesis GTPase YqeH [Thermotoga profunda]
MKCEGCGAQIQHESEKKPGYIPLDVFTKRISEGKQVLCQRCFRARHYGKLEPVRISKDFLHELSRIVDDFERIIWVLDITDFEGSYDPFLIDILRNKEKIIVVNKIDLLPRAVSIQEIKDWVLKRLEIERIEEIFLTSTLRTYGIRKLASQLGNFRKVLFVGVTNVGKSSLVRALTGADLSITPFPGTTLGLIKARMQGTTIFDTPGLVTEHRIIDLLPAECQKRIVAQKHLSRMTFKPENNKTFFIGGMCRFDIQFATEFLPIFQVFAGQGVKFHLTDSKKADELWERQYGKLLVPPCTPKQPSFQSLNWREEEFDLDVGEELAIAGLGWLSIRRGPLRIKVKIPEKITVKKRIALVNPYRGGMSDE